MAIIKHIAVKNRYYSAAVEYLTCKFDEHTMKPLVDDKGRIMMRDSFLIEGINCEVDCHPSHYKLPHPSNCLGLNVGSDTIPVKFMVPFPSHFGNRRRSQTHVGVNDSSHGI